MLTHTYNLYKESLSGLSRPVWLLTIVMFINRMGSMVLPFATIYLTQELGFSIAEAGFVMTCYGFGSLAGVYLGGKLVDTIGAWTVQVFSLFLTGICFFILMYVTTLIGFCIIYFCTSLIADTFRPANMVSMGLLAKPENRTRSMSLLRLAINLGYGAGSAIGGFLAITIGYGGLFIVDGMTCIFAGIFFATMIPHKRRTKEEKIAALAKKGSGKSPYQDKHFLGFVLMVFLNAVAFMQLFSLIPVYFKEVFFLNESEIGIIMAVNCFMLVAIEMPIIHHLEKKGYSKLLMCSIGSFLIMLAHLLFVFPAWSLLPIIFYIIFLTFGEMVNFPFASAHALDVSDPNNQGEYMGLYGMVWSAAFIIAPSLGGQLVEKIGWEALWFFTMVVGGLASLGYWVLYKKEMPDIIKRDDILDSAEISKV